MVWPHNPCAPSHHACGHKMHNPRSFCFCRRLGMAAPQQYTTVPSSRIPPCPQPLAHLFAERVARPRNFVVCPCHARLTTSTSAALLFFAQQPLIFATSMAWPCPTKPSSLLFFLQSWHARLSPMRSRAKPNQCLFHFTHHHAHTPLHTLCFSHYLPWPKTKHSLCISFLHPKHKSTHSPSLISSCLLPKHIQHSISHFYTTPNYQLTN